MYSVQQLQAADYLLKLLLAESPGTDSNTELKIVIELNGSYWYGDFLNFENYEVFQLSTNSRGFRNLTYDYANAAFIQKVWNTYNASEFRLRSFVEPKHHGGLFKKIFELIDVADIQADDSLIHPFLLNAKSLDGKLELPFLNIGNNKVHVISLTVQDSEGIVQFPKE